MGALRSSRVETIDEAGYQRNLFVQKERKDRKPPLLCSQILVVRDRRPADLAVCRQGDVLGGSRYVAVAPREDADVGLAAIHHLQDLVQRRTRSGDHVLHGDHLVAELSEDANGRGAVFLQVLER